MRIKENFKLLTLIGVSGNVGIFLIELCVWSIGKIDQDLHNRCIKQEYLTCEKALQNGPECYKLALKICEKEVKK